MNWKRILTLLITLSLVTLTAVAATELYVVRECLAAFLMFGILLVALGVIVLLSYIVGAAAVRCGMRFVAHTALSHLHQPAPLVVTSFTHGISKS
jgi:hypothetical protein